MVYSLSPFWCLCQKLSLSLLTLIKLCYTKALEWSSLIPGPEAKSLEILNLSSLIISYHRAALWTADCYSVFQSNYFFLDFQCENLVELLKIKLTKVWGPLMTRAPGVFNFQTWWHWAPSNFQLHFRFSYSGTGFMVASVQKCLLLVSQDFLYLPIHPVDKCI